MAESKREPRREEALTRASPDRWATADGYEITRVRSSTKGAYSYTAFAPKGQPAITGDRRVVHYAASSLARALNRIALDRKTTGKQPTREQRIERALRVMVEDGSIRTWLAQNDPQALAQARAALES